MVMKLLPTWSIFGGGLDSSRFIKGSWGWGLLFKKISLPNFSGSLSSTVVSFPHAVPNWAGFKVQQWLTEHQKWDVGV